MRLVREALGAILAHGGLAAFGASSREAVEAAAAERKPGMAVVDALHPEAAALIAARACLPGLSMVVLAMQDRDEGVVQNLPFLGHTGVRGPPVCEGRISTGRVSCAGGGRPPRGQARWG